MDDHDCQGASAPAHRGNPFFLEELVVTTGRADPARLAAFPLPWSLSEAVLRRLDDLKRFASSGDTLIVHHRDRPQWRRNEYASQWVARMRWMPRSATAVTSARVSAARLASSTPLRLAHSPSTGFSSGA